MAGSSNRVTIDNDPTSHAEVNTIREACRRLGTFNLSGCVIYTSCEPCPMCLGAIYWAHIDRIYYGNTRKDAADIAWTDAHPIKQVYMTCNCNTGQMMWDPMAVIQAVEGDDLFTLSPRGTVTLTPDAETIFTPSASGNCRYQLPGSADWNAKMLEEIRRYNKMM